MLSKNSGHSNLQRIENHTWQNVIKTSYFANSLSEEMRQKKAAISKEHGSIFPHSCRFLVQIVFFYLVSSSNP